MIITDKGIEHKMHAQTCVPHFILKYLLLHLFTSISTTYCQYLSVPLYCQYVAAYSITILKLMSSKQWQKKLKRLIQFGQIQWFTIINNIHIVNGLKITRVCNWPRTELHQWNWHTRKSHREQEKWFTAPDVRQSTNQWRTKERQQTLNSTHARALHSHI